MERIVQLMTVRDGGVLSVNPSPSWGDLLWRGGIDAVDMIFTPDRFPVQGTGRDVLVRVGLFDGEAYASDALAQAKAVGLQSFDTAELLAFAEKEVDLPNGYCFVALSAVGYLARLAKPYAAYLEVKDNKRRIRTASLYDEKWPKNTRFLLKQIV